VSRDGRSRGCVVLVVSLLAFGGPAAGAAHASDHPHGGMQPGSMGHMDGQGEGMESLGERIFEGKCGPWNAEVRLIDMKAQLEKSGVSAKAIAKLHAKHHLMVILTDPKTGKPVTDVTGEVTIRGPKESATSKVPLVVMGSHIGADVALPLPGKYSMRVTATGSGKNAQGYAVFDYRLMH
jgi:hypothetical protein